MIYIDSQIKLTFYFFILTLPKGYWGAKLQTNIAKHSSE